MSEPPGTEYRLFIEGQWREAAASGLIERRHPASGKLVACYARGNAGDIHCAVEAANRAFAEGRWSRCPPRERSTVLRAMAHELRAAETELATVEANETGKPLADALADIRAGAELWQYAAAALRTVHGEVYPDLAANRLGMTVVEPVGVVGLILPWNFPFIVSAERLPFLLAAGCSVVIKPSEYASGTALLSAELLKRAGLPDGVCNVVTGLGTEAGAALVDHDQVAMISFTGSSDNGRRVMKAASRTLKRVSLELGGKSPVIVFADADLERAANAVILGFTHNAGQCCIATSRLLVEAAIAERFAALLATKLERQPLTQPLATAAQANTVRQYIARASAEGDILLYQGRCDESVTGQGIGAHIFRPAPESALRRDELFGPVLTLDVFASEDEAIGMANDTAYGLAACVWTGAVERGLRVARRLRCGRLWINAPQDNYPELPVGGYKASGIGREAGRCGILAYSEVKSIILGGDS